jgi:Rieske Fe-S protein
MPDAEPNRRWFFNVVANLVLALLGLLIGIPVIGYFLAPLRRKSGAGVNFTDAGPLADLPVGEWRLRTLEIVQEDGWKKSRVKHGIWVRRLGQGGQDVAVLSSLCPHLGCPVNWQQDQARFHCPCHGGVFASDGLRIQGPPPRGMDPLEFEVRAGHLWVRWQDFKIGASTRTPVSS